MNHGRRSVRTAPWLIVLAAVWSTPAAAQQTAVTAGVSVRFLSGSFGSDRTTTLVYAPAVLRVERGRFEAAAFFPYLMIDNGTVAPSQGGFVPMRGTLSDAPNAGMSMGGSAAGSGSGMMDGGMTGTERSPVAARFVNRSGVGDVVVTAGYRIVEDARTGLQIVLGGRVKVPTASAPRGLGTGRVDSGASALVRKRFDRGWVYGEGGYVFIGDPGDIDLRNAALWGVGGGWSVTGRLGLLFSAYGNTALLAEFGAPIEIGAGVGINIGRATVSILPSVGLSEASPRYAVNVGLSADILRR